MNTYTLERIFAFVNAYAPVNDITVACGGGAIGLGFPVITNDKEDIQTVPKSLIVQPDTKAFIDTSLEARNIKIKVTKMDIPIAFNSAFEGEIIRKADMRLEIDGSRTDSFELVKMRDVREIEDHKITLSVRTLTPLSRARRNRSHYSRGRRSEMQSRLRARYERKSTTGLTALRALCTPVSATSSESVSAMQLSRPACAQSTSARCSMPRLRATTTPLLTSAR